MFRLWLCLLTFSFSHLICAEIYQWKDADGKVHYGQQSSETQKGAVTVEIRDKYRIPTVETLKAIRYTASGAHRLISFTNIKLALPNSDVENIRIGRIVCGPPIDLYWQKGVVDLQRYETINGSITKFQELGYKVGNGIGATTSPANLRLDADIVDFKMNMCPSANGKDVSQNGTYMKIRWAVKDILSEKTLFTGDSSGYHDALSMRAVKDGTSISFSAALAMATNNLLADPEFAKALVPVDMSTLAKSFDDKIPVAIQYGAGSGSFKDKIETLMKHTVIVKTSDGFGSGVIINGDGYVLTNAHVVGNETDFKVLIGDGTSDAKLVRKETVRDVALIRIMDKASALSGVDVARERPNVGDEIYIIGAPLSLENSQTTTKGIVSAFRDMQGLRYLQTDAAINHGSSGGPVFNDSGELIALTVAGILTRDGAGVGINYLIPIEDVFKFLNLGNAVNQNKILAKASTWIENLPQASDKKSFVYKVMPHVTWILNWLNSPLIPSLATLKSDTKYVVKADDASEDSGNNDLATKVEARYTKQGKFSQAVFAVHPLSVAIDTYYAQNKKWPISMSELNQQLLADSDLISSIDMSYGGTIHAVLASAIFGGQQYFELTPSIEASGSLSWGCKTTVEQVVRADSCKGI